MKFFKAAPGFFKAGGAVLGIALLAAAFSPRVIADSYDHMTTVTFSVPVEIPPMYVTGMRILPAGTYVFKLVGSNSDRHIVQIFNQDQTKIYATILAIADYRLTPKDKTVMTFNEGIAGKPEAIRAWFYPGAQWGEEFVYPKAKAVQLAQVSQTPVPAVVAEVTPEVEKPEAPEVLVQLQQLPIMAVRPTGEVVEIAQAIQPEPPVAAAPEAVAQAAPPATLPATASYFPLIALCGFLALGGAFALRFLGQRIQ